MVQVDIFWSFAIGAGFAASAGRQIKGRMDAGTYDLMENRYFTWAVLFLGALFAPSGILLLWGHTSWETMHFWNYHEALSKWIVVLFAITNVTQGVLGFWVASRFIRQRKYYEAFMMAILGYFLMFFILVHGWDGTGYRRFFTDTADQWLAGSSEPGPSLALNFVAHASVARSLYTLGVFLLPVMLYMMGLWIKQGYKLEAVDPEKAKAKSIGGIIAWLLFSVFAIGLGLAIVASICIRYLGWIGGSIVFLVPAYFLVVRKGMAGEWAANRIFLSAAEK